MSPSCTLPPVTVIPLNVIFVELTLSVSFTLNVIVTTVSGDVTLLSFLIVIFLVDGAYVGVQPFVELILEVVIASNTFVS